MTAAEGDDLTERCSDVTAPDTPWLSVPEGRPFGLLGPSGSGETTTEVPTGRLDPTAGSAAPGLYGFVFLLSLQTGTTGLVGRDVRDVSARAGSGNDGESGLSPSVVRRPHVSVGY